jgi:P27 family predicted phage terminase small subunit
MEKEGISVTGERGLTVKKHPAFSVWKTALDQFTRLCEQFGLTPMARNRLKIHEPEKEEEDGKKRFFKFEK